jgi:branched-chain amino acid aminotransferase
MPALVNLDGDLLPPEAATVPVLDRGFLYGDSVYEVCRTYRGVPFALDRHFKRLQQSAARLELPLPALDDLEREIARTLRAAGNEESYVRIVVTRGVGQFGLAPHLSEERRVVVIVKPLEPPKAELYERGLKLAVVPIRRNPPRALDPALKTGNYLNSVLALAQARRMGGDDALMLDLVGRVTELSSSNVFFVKDGVVVTPALSLGLLEGITRAVVMELGRARGLIVREAFHGPEALAGADEVFVTSTLREVMPVTELLLGAEGATELRAVGAGKPGPFTKQLRDAFHGHVEAWLKDAQPRWERVQ